MMVKHTKSFIYDGYLQLFEIIGRRDKFIENSLRLEMEADLSTLKSDNDTTH